MVSRAALIVSGIAAPGYREILGVHMGDTKSFATWDETFRWLKGRGLKGVMFVVSDDHGGLTESELAALPRPMRQPAPGRRGGSGQAGVASARHG